MKKSKIKINPVTMEIEIEVSDSFLKKYFKKLKDQSLESKKATPTIKSIITSAKPVSKIKTVKTKKTKPTPIVKKRKGSIQDRILEKIKMGKDKGISVNEIVESTRLNRKQIYNVTKRLKSRGLIKTSGTGVYIYVEK